MKAILLSVIFLGSISAQAKSSLSICRWPAIQGAIAQAAEDSADPENAPTTAEISQVLKDDVSYLVEVDGGAFYIVTTQLSADGKSCKVIEAHQD